ncbi:MAG: DUF5723 family protein [Paludibacteraceae bacterium]|nr:DUF5723 family protein [Paludibacteraceae bacterium]
MKKFDSNLHKKVAAIAAATLFIGNASAQTSSLYFMKWNPQQHLLNPAFQPKGKFYFGLPAFSYMGFNAGNSDLVLTDIIQNITVNGEKKTVLFIDHNARSGSVDDYLDALSDGTRVFYEHRINLLNCGFKTKLGFFTLDVSNRANTSVLIPKALSILALKGMNEGETFIIDGKDLAADATVFSQLALGLSKPINDDLTVGAKLKFLYGHGDLHTNFRDMRITGNENEWAIRGDADIMAALPGLTIKEKEDGQIDNLDVDIDDDNIADVAKPQGKGFAIDLGATYKINPNITVSASVIDLGLIRWNKNLHKIRKVNDFVWDGIEYDINDDTTNYGKEYEEMFEAMFRQDGNAKAYNTWLNTKIFLGGEYSFWKDRLGLGLLGRGEVYQGKFYGNGVASANFRPWRQFSASVTYGLFDGHWNNLGAGININAGPINMFLNAEHIPLKYAKDDALIIPSHTNQFELCMGANIYIGYSKKRELKEMNNIEGLIDTISVAADSSIAVLETADEPNNANEGDVWVEDPQNELPEATKMEEPKAEEVKATVKEEIKEVKEDANTAAKKAEQEAAKKAEEAKAEAVKKEQEAKAAAMKAEQEAAKKAEEAKAEAAKKEQEAKAAAMKAEQEAAKKAEEAKAEVTVATEDVLKTVEESETSLASNGEPTEIAASNLTPAQTAVKKEAVAKIKFLKDPSTIALDPSCYPALDKLVEELNSNPNLTIGIYSHSSLVKNKNYTYFLTEERANVVRGYLVDKGIDYSRIKTVGMGNDQPNPFGDNTRTEIKFFR